MNHSCETQPHLKLLQKFARNVCSLGSNSRAWPKNEAGFLKLIIFSPRFPTVKRAALVKVILLNQFEVKLSFWPSLHLHWNAILLSRISSAVNPQAWIFAKPTPGGRHLQGVWGHLQGPLLPHLRHCDVTQFYQVYFLLDVD